MTTNDTSTARNELKKIGLIRPELARELLNKAVSKVRLGRTYVDRDGQMLELLFEFGVDPNMVYQHRPIWLYGLSSDQSISVPALKLLLVKITNPNQGSEIARTNAITQVFSQNTPESDIRYDVVECLLEAGVNPNVPSNMRSPLLTAGYAGRLDLVKLLLSHSAQPLVRNRLYIPHPVKPWLPGKTIPGQTLMHVACLRQTTGNLEVLDYLLKSKVVPATLTTNGETPYAMAKRKGNLAAVKIFEKHGIKH